MNSITLRDVTNNNGVFNSSGVCVFCSVGGDTTFYSGSHSERNFSPALNEYTVERSFKQYELTDHLGNVQATISDRKIPVDNTSDISHYLPVLLTRSEMYPFGWAMPGRGLNMGEYRFGFNGMEKDDEVKGSGNSYTTEWRQYDPRVGRFLSRDPLANKFPWQSPYVAFDNNPIFFIDPSGDSSRSTVVKYEGSSSYSSETGQVTVMSSKVTNTEMYGPNKKGGTHPWLGTLLETVTTKTIIDEDGEIVSSTTTTSYLGWDGKGSWDLESSTKTSNNLEDAPIGHQKLVGFESGFIKEKGMSTHQYTADFAARRNQQNKREFLAGLPLRAFELATGRTVSEAVLTIFSTTLDYATSPNEYFGVSEENPDNIVRHVKWKD